ncbi:MAG: large repetitive protein [Solirubrobacteraceae bacterium]|nr:large repetitive protein [Solirubrobacteraceae bacterium]
MAHDVMRGGAQGSAPTAAAASLQKIGGRREPALNAGIGTTRRSRVRAGALAVAVAAGALAAPSAASAAINSPPQNGHGIIVFPVRDFVSASGYARTDVATVEVLRNGTLIGRASGLVPKDDPKTPGFDGLVEVNHPGGGCWGDGAGSPNVTPDILPQDVVRVTTAPGAGDETTTADVTSEPPLNPAPGVIEVHGTAQDAAGKPIPVDQLEQRMVAPNQDFAASGGRRSIRADGVAGGEGTLSYDGAGSTHWTATYSNLSDADVTTAMGAQSRGMWLGVNPGTTAEGTIFEYGEVGGPGAPCAAPLAKNAVLSSTPASVNGAFAAGSGALRLSGVAQPGTVSAAVSLTDAAGKRLDATDVALNGSTWTASFPASDVRGLADGPMTASAAYTLDTGGTIGGLSLTIDKDTQGPALAPTAQPGAGLFNSDQSVILTADPSADIFYTTDGTTPTAASTVYTGAIPVTASKTIKTLAIDQAGNTGPAATYAYAIDKVAPKTTDDVGTAPVAPNTPVHLSSDDGTGSGVAVTYYSTSGDPAALPVSARKVYDPQSPPVLTDGQVLRYFSVDKAGNEEATHASLAAKVDSAAPVTTDDVPATSWSAAPVAVTLTATDADGVAATYYTTDGTDPRSSSSRTAYAAANKPTLANGKTLRYSSVDKLGNVELPRTTAAAKVDTAAPITNDDVPTSPTAFSATDVTVTLAAGDGAGSGVASTWYTLNGTDPRDELNANRRQYSGAAKPTLANGQAITYVSIDNVGNVGVVKSSATAHVDKAAPATTDNVPATWGTADVTVTLTAGDGTGGSGVATTWYTTDGSDPTLASNGARKAYSATAKPVLTTGQTIRYASVDNVGNVEAVHAAAAKVDKTAPVTTDSVTAATQPAAQPVTLTATDAGSGVAATWYTTDGSDPTVATNAARRRYDPAAKPTLANGQKITYYSIDALGNAEAKKVSAIASVKAPVTTTTPVATRPVTTATPTATAAPAPAPAAAAPAKAAPAAPAAPAPKQPAIAAPAPAATLAALPAPSVKAPSALSAASAKKRGLSFTVDVPAGASVVEVQVARLGGAQAATAAAAAKQLAKQLFLTNGKGGTLRIRLTSAKLRRQLKPGVYELRIRVGASATKLGAPTTRKLRIRK